MPSRTLTSEPSFSALREEVSFSLIRLALQKDKDLKGAGKGLAAAAQRLPAVEEEQYEVWNAQVSADARISFADDALDDFVVRLANESRAAGVVDVFFSESPTRFAQPVLGDQLDAMRPWIKALAEQDDKRFAGLDKELRSLLSEADDAVKERQATNAAAVAFRKVGGYRKLVNEVVKARDELWAELDTVRRSRGLPRDFADRFFKRPTVKVSEQDRAAKAAATAKAKAERLARDAAIKDARAKMKVALAELKSLTKAK